MHCSDETQRPASVLSMEQSTVKVERNDMPSSLLLFRPETTCLRNSNNSITNNASSLLLYHSHFIALYDPE